MMSVGFFEKLKAFDKDELVKNDRLNRFFELFIQDNPDFVPEIVKNTSKACYSLCKWCFALKNYAKIALQVQPKQ
jgi:dynein heavy chain, axonemal